MNKKYSYTILRPRLFFLLIVITLANTRVAMSSQEDFELLIDALKSEKFEEFSVLIDNGADSNFIGNGFSPSQWVNCLAARKESDVWLATIQKNGGNLDYAREEYLSHMGRSRYANALTCSVINSSTEPFRFLVKNGAEIQEVICPLCKQEVGKRSLLEFITSFRQFNKSAWLLENHPEVKRQINEKVIHHLELQTALREDRTQGFWKTIDLIRANGHTVNPKVTR